MSDLTLDPPIRTSAKGSIKHSDLKPLRQSPHIASDRVPFTENTGLEAHSSNDAADKPQQKLWMPKQVLITPAALEEDYGQALYENLTKLGLPIKVMPSNRITGINQKDVKKTYKTAKTTLAIVKAPPGAFKLRPIPPSADWQFHLAEGCPGHCQYCYLAGSLSGPPIVRVFANLEAILKNTAKFETAGSVSSFEASCYTDPLSIEHLTGGLAKTIEHFGKRSNAHLRWVTKYDNVEPLLNLAHAGNTRCRISLNVDTVARKLEGGTASIAQRLQALRRLALPKAQGGGAYPVGVVLAPIMQLPDWREQYTAFFDELSQTMNFDCDLTFELITHRFTPGSKDILLQWYPATKLDLDETLRSEKRNKFGGKKYVFKKDLMKEMKSFFYSQIERRFPKAEILYWT